jgi:hypothetical protein
MLNTLLEIGEKSICLSIGFHLSAVIHCRAANIVALRTFSRRYIATGTPGLMVALMVIPFR